MIFIDDWPRDSLLVTDYGGYLNLLNSAVTFGLAQSEEAVARSYRDATLDFLVQSQLSCSQRRSKDLWDRTFEILRVFVQGVGILMNFQSATSRPEALNKMAAYAG